MARLLSLALLVAVSALYWDFTDGGALHYNEFYSLYNERGEEYDFDKCSKQPPLQAKIKLWQSAINPDGDEYITQDEIRSKFYAPFDVDGDGCVSYEEWIRRTTYFFRFSHAFSDRIYIGDQGLDCALNISSLISVDPGANATLVWDQYIQALITLCDADTTRYCINDDCSGLQELCTMTEYKNMPSCVGFNPAVQKCDK